MVRTENFQKIEIGSSDQLREWLEINHEQLESVWLVTFKKHVDGKYVSTSEVLDELLSFGWIDGIRRKLDKDRTMQLISPRKSQHWSKTYKYRAQNLINKGKMAQAGFESIADSKRKGLWDFLNDVDALILPEDLIKELQKYPDAFANFNAFNDSSKRFTLRWIKLAKSSKTRSERIQKTARSASQNQKIT